jgi:drug/metabolite transporter (DMT)-like permease
MFALGSALLLGVGFAIFAQAAQRLAWPSVTLIEYLAVNVVVVAIAPILGQKEHTTWHAVARGLRNRFVYGVAVLWMIGFLALNFAIAHSTSSGGAVATAVSACYPIITVFLALKHFDEKTELVPLLGAFVGIAGVVLLSVS